MITKKAMFEALKELRDEWCSGDYEPFEEWDDEECLKSMATDCFTPIKKVEDALENALEQEF